MCKRLITARFLIVNDTVSLDLETANDDENDIKQTFVRCYCRKKIILTLYQAVIKNRYKCEQRCEKFKSFHKHRLVIFFY